MVNFAVSIFGQFDLMMPANLHEFEMLDSFLKNDLYSIKGVKRIQIHLISEQKKLYEGMFKDNKIIQKAVIDETDENLIRILMKNGRTNYVDISKDLNISISSISKRIDSLIKESIIQIVAVPNPTKFGYSVDAFVALQCELDKIDSICTQLGNVSKIYMVMRLMNGYDIIFGIRSLNPDALYRFLSTRINTIDGILNTETFIRGNHFYISPEALFPRREQW